jgi:hypothetical protein
MIIVRIELDMRTGLSYELVKLIVANFKPETRVYVDSRTVGVSDLESRVDASSGSRDGERFGFRLDDRFGIPNLRRRSM